MAELTPEAAVRTEIEAMGGQLPQRVSALLARFGYDTTTPPGLSAVEARLATVAVGSVPPLSLGAKRVFVTLYLLDSASDQLPAESPTETALEAASEGVGVGTVIAGALVTGAAFSLIGFPGYWLYGAIYLALTIATLGLIRWRLPFILRLFLPRFPFLRLGLLLGAATMVSLAALVSLAVILPISVARSAAARTDAARSNLAEAERDLNRYDLAAAERNVNEAREADDQADGLDEIDDRLSREQALDQRYRGAIAAVETGDYQSGIGDMGALAGENYRDADRRAEEFRARAARGTLSEGLDALGSDPFNALRLGQEADAYRSTPATRSLIAEARLDYRRLQAGLAAARRRAEQQRQAAAQRRAEARQRRAEERRQQRLLDRQQEEESYSGGGSSGGGSSGGGSSGGGSSGFACGPGDIDGDGDGRCNE